ncbi:hypothetical protein L7F22_007621 [Adiantum nelumboides]|nr:hypothetical protein [Adiantum nelumboides]
MQESLTFPTLGSPPRFTFPELTPSNHVDHHHQSCCSELSSSTSTPFVSAPSSPSRLMKGFYFSAPTSPTWARTIHQQQRETMENSSCQSINSWSTLKRLPCQPHFHGDTAGISLTQAPNSAEAEVHASSPWASPTEPPVSSVRSASSAQMEHHGSSNSPLLQTHHKSSSSWSPESFPSELEKGPNWGQPPLETEHHSSWSRHQRASQIEHSRSSLLSLQAGYGNTREPHDAGFNDADSKRVHVDDQSYSRNSLYASAVPFAWEEKPGTPKARSVTSEASNGEDDASSVLLSGSSEFEFSARFAEFEEAPMSPTPISTPSNSFKHHVDAYNSCSSTMAKDRMQRTDSTPNEQIWPLRPPPCLDNPVLPMKQLIKDNTHEHKRSYGSLSSLSAPQSPHSPRKFDIRGVLCGISSLGDAVFDPFLVAMEKSMEEDKRSFAASREAPHHRRTRSSSPLRIFHWDDHSAKSNSSSNGSSSTDDGKSKHPIQREIDARHNAGTPKGSKRWSFRGFLHRKSDSGGESARHSNTSSSLRSSGRESNLSSTSRRESCSSSGTGEVPIDLINTGDDMNNMKTKSASSPRGNNCGAMLSSMPSASPSIPSPSASNNSSKVKIKAHHKASQKGPYALHYGTQRVHTEELTKKTFLPYKQGLLGCLGFSSKIYRAITTLSKPLQSVS